MSDKQRILLALTAAQSFIRHGGTYARVKMPDGETKDFEQFEVLDLIFDAKAVVHRPETRVINDSKETK